MKNKLRITTSRFDFRKIGGGEKNISKLKNLNVERETRLMNRSVYACLYGLSCFA